MKRIEELIHEGQTFSFKNNSYVTSHGAYSRPTDDLLAWVTTVEDFIRTNYGEESAAFKLFLTSDKRKLTGYLQSEFEGQMAILMAALKSCKSVAPKSKSKEKPEDNAIMILIKNPLFWSVIVLATGAAFGLGFQIGLAKFDKDKIALFDENRLLEDSINNIGANRLVTKYILELNNREIQIEEYLNQLDTVKQEDKWVPALYIWRIVIGDNAYEPIFKEFKGKSMVEMTTWIKLNTSGIKDSQIDYLNSHLISLALTGGAKKPYEVDKVKGMLAELNAFIKCVKATGKE